ncbi:hypothetical protein GOBAR_AA06805 [Gossypium barbadense]|uniref:DUF4283 domain-containing protein n=1 Tax=Gossypium barbadense TaxID=3634 RepID=A0A2P5YDU5_GOSBA|nr:hypothetical protein GOBAR_AA06805 [Gossypium barbadense]
MEHENIDEGDMANRSTKKVRIRETEGDLDVVMDSVPTTGNLCHRKIVCWVLDFGGNQTPLKEHWILSVLQQGVFSWETVPALAKFQSSEDFEKVFYQGPWIVYG